MDSIITHKLSYRKGKNQILNNISLKVPKGSIYGYLGRNGAGKSTTIKLLLGLLEEEGDHIFIQNLSLKTDSTKIHSITGNLIESPCFYTRLTVYENLKYLDIIHGRGEKRIEHVLELVDLKQERNKRASALSMGMKQRMGIAIAIYHDPEILILDEPLNGLDPQGIFEMRKLFKSLNEQGKTIFLSSHILSELDKTATHIGIIDKGHMVFQGTKNELLKDLRRNVLIAVSQPERAGEILIENGFTVTEKDDKSVSVAIHKDTEFHALVQVLAGNNLEIKDVNSHLQDLEQIFMNLISKNND